MDNMKQNDRTAPTPQPKLEEAKRIKIRNAPENAPRSELPPRSV